MNKFCFDWKFKSGEISGAHLPEYDDSNWRSVDIPHDYCIEQDFDKQKGVGCTAYFTGTVAWYRKTFKTTPAMIKGSAIICFDGVYNNADFYINGKYLGFHPYGYSPFNFDITPYLNASPHENVFAVRVDHTRYADSRWYSGSGIYRNVELVTLPSVRIPVWGQKVETPCINSDSAVVKFNTDVENVSDDDKKITINYKVIDKTGKVSAFSSEDTVIEAGGLVSLQSEVIVSKPHLWSVDKPYQYTTKTSIILDGKEIQCKSDKIGIRTILFDKNKGFFLNGKHTYLKGVCLHHDAGLIGSAFIKGIWKIRFQKLKECGCNAIRTSHNPVSADFLELCDEMGFLVQEEFFDEWDNPKDKRYNGNERIADYISRGYSYYFHEWAETDLKTTMLRDQNHPCIIMWSIGNEIEWTYPKYNLASGYFGADATGNYFWTLPPKSVKEIKENIRQLPEDYNEVWKTAAMLSGWVKEMDKTRPVVANCILPSVSYESGYTDALDVVGYSYRAVIYDYGHKNYPDKPILGTENLGQWHEWKSVIDRDFVAGMFIWTGFDYLGESGKEHDKPWPIKNDNQGFIDTACFAKPAFYMMKSLWTDKPSMKIYTQTLDKSLYELKKGKLIEKEKDGWKHRMWEWQDVNTYWDYKANEDIVIEAYSNCEKAEAFLNGKSFGMQKLSDNDDHIYKWCIPYQKGTVIVVGYDKNNKISDSLSTTGECKNINLDVTEFNEGRYSYYVCIATILDEKNNIILKQDNNVKIDISKGSEIMGVDNGSCKNVEPYRRNSCITKDGHCMFVVRAEKTTDVKIKVSCKNAVAFS